MFHTRSLATPISYSRILVALSLLVLRVSATQFTIDETQSKITMAGTVLGNTVQEQGPNSLTTSFYGTINANVSGSTIQFTGDSSLNARTNGVWRPGPGGASGSAPAAYAAQATTIIGALRGALRNVLLDVKSAQLPIGAGGQFDASALVFGFPTNSNTSFDYDAGFLGSKGLILTGLSTNKIVNGATLTGSGDSQTLTIQVDAEFKFKAVVENDSSVRLTGKLVAAAASLPSITSISVKNQTVTLRVQGTGPEPRLDSSGDLLQWTTQSPTRTTEGTDMVLTLPATNLWQFYRVAK